MGFPLMHGCIVGISSKLGCHQWTLRRIHGSQAESPEPSDERILDLTTYGPWEKSSTETSRVHLPWRRSHD